MKEEYLRKIRNKFPNLTIIDFVYFKDTLANIRTYELERVGARLCNINELMKTQKQEEIGFLLQEEKKRCGKGRGNLLQASVKEIKIKANKGTHILTKRIEGYSRMST
jgi:hypothetical protein